MQNDDLNTITKIASRAVDLAAEHGQERDVLTLTISVAECHKQCPLDLAGLLASQDVDLAHDIFGIDRHMDRVTKKLQDCFLPRYALTQN